MSNEWIGVINTTAPKYIKGAADLTIRERLFLAMLEKRGLITYNNVGTDIWWDVQYAEPPVESYGDGGTINYSRRDLFKQAHIDVRGYLATDAMTEKERLMNAGDVAIVNRYERILPNLVNGIRNRFGTELYIDGNASGNENRLCGLESWMGVDDSSTTDAMGACPAAQIMAGPSDTYAGLSTALAQSGSWVNTLGTSAAYGRQPTDYATDWPEGSGDTEYDFFAPKIYNTAATNTYWGVTSNGSFADVGESVLRKSIQHLRLTAGAVGAPALCMLAGDYFYDLKRAMSAKQQIFVPHKEADDLGFPDTLNFEGVAINSEFGVPASTGYLLMLNEMELMSYNSELFGQKGPEWDPKTYSYLFSVSFFGNLKIKSPKFSAKFHKYPTS